MAKKPAPIQHWIALLATIFVVGGIVAIAQLQPRVEEPGEGAVTASDAALAGRVVVFADHGAFHVIAPEGVELRECALDAAARIVDVTREGVEVGLGSGDRVRIGFDCVASDVPLPQGIATADRLQAARIGDPDDAGVTLLVMEAAYVLPGGMWTEEIPLRFQGRPLREPQVLGWLNRNRVAVIAFQGDARLIFSVDETGEIQRLTSLPELVDGFAVGGEAVWYVSATPGPGIEFGPQGPSALHRVGLDGEDEVVARDGSSVLEALSVSSDGAYAYLVGGTLFIGRNGEEVNVGVGIPVGWSDDGRVLVADRQQRLSFKSPEREVIETGIVLPQGVSEVWSVALDDGAETE